MFSHSLESMISIRKNIIKVLLKKQYLQNTILQYSGKVTKKSVLVQDFYTFFAIYQEFCLRRIRNFQGLSRF